jgi:rod shape determining protein RodA
LFRRLIVRADISLFVIVVLLLAFGCLMIYSCTHGATPTKGESRVKKVYMQLIWIALGIVLMALTMAIDYNKLLGFALPIMGTVAVLLVIVLFVGGHVRATQRWIPLGPMHLQPSELAKLAVILLLGAFLSHHEEERETFALVGRSLGYIAVPWLLILAQPDLGTPVVIGFVWFTMMFVLGARVVHLGAFVFAFLMLFSAAWTLNLVRPHQKERLVAFTHPERDPNGSGWQLKQSLIAIGSGHFWGQGLFHGTQTQGAFIPDQETDFVFTSIGEEWGFLGGLLVVLLFAALLYRGVAVCASAKDTAGRLIAGGVTALILIHVFVNIGMTMGMMPVKGMPLPFISYGGSSMMTMLIAVGLLQSVHMRRHKIIF